MPSVNPWLISATEKLKMITTIAVKSGFLEFNTVLLIFDFDTFLQETSGLSPHGRSRTRKTNAASIIVRGSYAVDEDRTGGSEHDCNVGILDKERCRIHGVSRLETSVRNVQGRSLRAGRSLPVTKEGRMAIGVYCMTPDEHRANAILT